MGKAPSLKFVLCAFLAVPLLGGNARAADKVTVGVIPITDVAPIYLGVAKGFFTKQNLDVTLRPRKAAPNGHAGADRPAQFGFSNIGSLLIAQTRGLVS